MFTALVRTIILYIIIITGVRLMGKRQVGELEPSELVLSLLISDLAAVPMQDPGTPLYAGIIPILVLLSVTMLLSVATMKNSTIRTLICGRPSIIIQNGELNQKEMKRNRLTVDELLEELRCQGHTDPSAIQYAILETNGQLSILPKSQNLPATVGQLHIETPAVGLPLVIISDGRVVEQALSRLGRDYSWLDYQLKKHNFKQPEDIFLMTSDEHGVLYFSPKHT